MCKVEKLKRITIVDEKIPPAKFNVRTYRRVCVEHLAQNSKELIHSLQTCITIHSDVPVTLFLICYLLNVVKNLIYEIDTYVQRNMDMLLYIRL